MINGILELIRKGSEKEKSGDLEEALDIYVATLQKWDHICKYQDDEKVRSVLLSRMEQLVSRAESIKSIIGSNKHKASSAGRSSSSALSKDSDKATDGYLEYLSDPLYDNIRNCVLLESPNVSWEDIIGLEKAKSSLKEAVVIPVKFPELFKGNLRPWKGILLYGPPGTGKTFLAKACATEMKGTFLSISSADLTSKWQGESEKLIKALFDVARQRAPSVIFIDEIDSLCSSRNEQENEATRRIKTEFLVQMDGLSTSSGQNGPFRPVLVLGTTNVPWDIDSGIRRRFERRIYIPLPDEESRLKLIRNALKSADHELSNDDILHVARETNGYSSSDVCILIKDALFEPIRKCSGSSWFKKVEVRSQGADADGGGLKIYWTPCSQPADLNAYDRDSYRNTSIYEIQSNQLLPPKLTREDLTNVLSRAKSSVADRDIDKFNEWTDKFGLSGD